MNGAMTVCHSAANPYPDCAAHYELSRLLSELVLDSFCGKTGMADLSCREMDNMTGTNWSRVPTTIVEMGFLSNEADDRLMATEAFHQNAAVGIADGLDAYFAATVGR
jgi:N-acetylmuramoyl-L-alanine amidase